jgi:hypothetical protein
MSSSTLVAAAAGLFGVAMGGWLAGRQQRSAQLRAPMLDVALDFVEALRGAVPDAPNEPREATAAAREQLSRAFTLSHRVVLIFGPDAPAGEQAIEAYFATLTAFDHAEKPLDVEERIVDDEARARSIWVHEHEQVEFKAERAVDGFSVAAGRAIRSGGRHPWFDAGRRLRQRVFQTPSKRKVLRELRSTAEQARAAEEGLKESDKALRRALDEAEAHGVEMPIDLSGLEAEPDE